MTAKNKKENKTDLKIRTKQFALNIIRIYSTLPKTNLAQTIGNQLLRSGTSVGANYRESCRARSNAEFISKLHIALQELEETAYWLELLVESNVTNSKPVNTLYSEVDELTAIFVTIIKKTQNK